MQREPALMAGGVVSTIVALAVAYGLLDLDKAELWKALAISILPLLQAWWTRQQVVPVSKVHDAGISVAEINARAG
jgi:hypothetical protein